MAEKRSCMIAIYKIEETAIPDALAGRRELEASRVDVIGPNEWVGPAIFFHQPSA